MKVVGIWRFRGLLISNCLWLLFAPTKKDATETEKQAFMNQGMSNLRESQYM